MPYDERLAERLRGILKAVPRVFETRLMGGLTFLVDGNMAVSASGRGGLMLRVAPAQTVELASKPHAERVVMRGKEVLGWIRVCEAGFESDADLRAWVERGVAYARSLPAKD